MKRIQRKRTKGWRKPANTVYVGRDSLWGNPYRLGEYTREEALRLYRERVEWIIKKEPAFLDPLKGKDLACWCSETESCHADILIEIIENTGVLGERNLDLETKSPAQASTRH
jgi:hypothetical protein